MPCWRACHSLAAAVSAWWHHVVAPLLWATCAGALEVLVGKAIDGSPLEWKLCPVKSSKPCHADEARCSLEAPQQTSVRAHASLLALARGASSAGSEGGPGCQSPQFSEAGALAHHRSSQRQASARASATSKVEQAVTQSIFFVLNNGCVPQDRGHLPTHPGPSERGAGPRWQPAGPCQAG